MCSASLERSTREKCRPYLVFGYHRVHRFDSLATERPPNDHYLQRNTEGTVHIHLLFDNQHHEKINTDFSDTNKYEKLQQHPYMSLYPTVTNTSRNNDSDANDDDNDNNNNSSDMLVSPQWLTKLESKKKKKY